MKKNSLFVFLMLPMVWLAGCSDYASEGVVDTRIVREIADIEEITGSVYGLKDGAQEAIIALHTDEQNVRRIDDEVWEAVKAEASDAELPTLSLQYEGVDSSQVLSSYDTLVAAARAKYGEEVAEYNAEMAELENEIAGYKATLADLETSKAEHDAHIAQYQKAYDEIVAKVEAAKVAYNAVFASAIEEVTAAAEKEGINGRYSDSLIGRYRSIDYSKRSSSPKTCPAQRGYFAVDVRDVNQQCAYLTVPRNIAGTPAEAPVKAIMADKFKQFLKAEETLGKKRNWGSSATGLFAQLDAAKDALSKAAHTADEKYGSARSRNYKLRNTNQYLERLNRDLAKMQTDEYLHERVLSTYLIAPDAFKKAYQDYSKAMEEHFVANYVEKASDITMAEVDGVTVGSFEDIGSGYTHLVALSDILTNRNGRKEVVRSLGMLTTDAPEVADADELTFAVTSDNIKQRGRDISEERKMQEVIGFLIDTLKS